MALRGLRWGILALAALTMLVGPGMVPKVMASDAITFTVKDIRVQEGAWAVITVEASEPLKDPIKLVFRTSDGTATAADGDYEPWRHNGRMKKGDISKSWRVGTVADDLQEGEETFYISVSFRKAKKVPAGYVIDDGQAEVTIVEKLNQRERRSAAYLHPEAHWRQVSRGQEGHTRNAQVQVYWNNDGRYRCIMIRRLDSQGNEHWVTGDPNAGKTGCNRNTSYEWRGGTRSYVGKPWTNDMKVKWGETYQYTVYAAHSPPDGRLSYSFVSDAWVTLPARPPY
jgi:hypothetical protein